MKTIRLFVALVVMLSAAPALADEQFQPCGKPLAAVDPANAASTPQDPILSPGELTCWAFDAVETSPEVQVSSKGQACLDPTGSCTVILYRKLPRCSGASCPQACADAGCTLNGVGGTPAAQTACVPLDQGTYYAIVQTAPAPCVLVWQGDRS